MTAYKTKQETKWKKKLLKEPYLLCTQFYVF